MFNRILIPLAIAVASTSSVAQGIGSQAQLWSQKTKQEQVSYLEGYCEALKVSEAPLGKLACYEVREPANSRELFRFCGAASINSGRSAVSYLDAFYKDKRHSDIPLWAAAAAFNDRACRERTTDGKLEQLQREGECTRQLTALVELKVAKAVLDRHVEECRAKR